MSSPFVIPPLNAIASQRSNKYVPVTSAIVKKTIFSSGPARRESSAVSQGLRKTSDRTISR